MIDVVLLGTGGTVPLPGRWLSALLVRIGSDLTLFDCGEATQLPMRSAGWGFKPVSTICLSHLHADHVAGLPGLLLTVGNAGRVEPLTIYGPAGTRSVVNGLRTIAPRLPFDVRIREVAGGETIPLGSAQMRTLALEHAVPCRGYRLDVPRARRFDPERAQARGIPMELWSRLQHGETVAARGHTFHPDDVLGPSRRGLSLAYITDTRPIPTIAPFVAGADLLVCEANYGDPADAKNALENRHMLFSEAAAVARDANVRRLWLTHFSAKVLDPQRYTGQATTIFPTAQIGRDGMQTTLRFVDEAEAPRATTAADAPSAPTQPGRAPR
ncbi:MAG: ribonuclease Z [Chloroflexi bacterium]|nr:ribonuclease Z [Chloroflexota bacterium]